jgi:di/tripeptidase
MERFQSTDDLMNHLNTFVPTLPDEELKSKYAGFLSASAVTVYELAIKDICIEFAEKKNKTFGFFIEKHFSRINGQILIKDIKNYVGKFGEKYLTKFNTKLEKKKNELLGTYRNDIQAVYGNLITCRHKFIHTSAHTMTFNEVVQSYQMGKEIINVLNDTMR